jgi:hypothetical protein
MASEDDNVHWTGQVYGCEIGPYLVYVPVSTSDKSLPSILVLQNTGEAILNVLGEAHSLWEDKHPIVTVDDKDKDGAVDYLTYSIYLNGFDDELQVMDINYDGQPDIRIRRRAGRDKLVWLWVENGWYEKIADRRYVLVNGVETPYELSDGALVFSKTDKQ